MFTPSIRRGPLLFLAAWMIVCNGCARYTLLEADSGVIAIPANLPVYRKQADKLMQERCPEGYVIEREEEIWRNEEIREWRIYFRSKDPARITSAESQETPFLVGEAILAAAPAVSLLVPVSFIVLAVSLAHR